VTSFREKYEEIAAANAEVLEISVDNVASQRAWAEQLGGVDFPLLADFHPKGAVAKAYGVYNEERGTAMRSVFIVDESGIVRDTEVFPQGMIPNATEVLKKLAAL
jgi:alkyl hydroperoxide reductase subunit AhpC